MNHTEFLQYKQQFCIALTGGIASGKSAVASYLRQQGFVVVDADQLSRRVLEPGTEGYREVLAVFGNSILKANGELHREALRQQVFNHEELREKLEVIVHSKLDDALIRELQALPELPRDIWFYEASLIIETGKTEQFHEIWLVKSEPELQKLRLRASRSLDETDINAIMARQWSFEKKAPFASLIINNFHSLNDLYRTLDGEIRRLRQEGTHVPSSTSKS